MNSIDAKGSEFLQLNAPGNDGYGQEGSKGETGINGNSVYFSSFKDASVPACAELILQGKELSNNPQYVSSTIEYKTNDVVIDKSGHVYMLNIDNDTVTFLSMRNIFSYGSIIDNMDCVLHISDTPQTQFFYKVPNENYVGEYNDNSGSPYIYHRDRYKGFYCGSWILFDVNVTELSDCLYKYVLMLPNGLKIENTTTTSQHTMFVDNRFLYGCVFDESPEETATLKEIGDYHNIEQTNEYGYNFTAALARKIVDTCTAYVEVTDMTSRKVYRKYARRIDIEIESEETPEEISEETPEENEE